LKSSHTKAKSQPNENKAQKFFQKKLNYKIIMIKKQIKIKSIIKVDCCFWHSFPQNPKISIFMLQRKIVCLKEFLGKKFVRIKLLFVAIFGYPFLPWFFFYRRWKVGILMRLLFLKAFLENF
jgi:hypothetical protein